MALPARRHVPDANDLVVAAAGRQLAITAENDAVHGGGMAPALGGLAPGPAGVATQYGAQFPGLPAEALARRDRLCIEGIQGRCRPLSWARRLVAARPAGPA